MVKKILSVMLMMLVFVLAIGVVSAGVASETMIAGKIYNSDYTNVIEGATVTVTCGGNDLIATSLADGAYKVKYTGVCVIGDTLTVYAEKDGLSGMKTGTIRAEGECANPASENCLINVYSGLDIAVVNVPLVPEFGTVVGILTVMGALGAFFIVRRK